MARSGCSAPTDAATWSPRGLFVAAIGDGDLVAVDPQVRFAGRSHARVASAIRSGLPTATGSPIAIETRCERSPGGTGDHLSWPSSAAVAPAWRPGRGHELTLVEPDGGLRTIDADSGRSVSTAAPGLRPVRLEWSRDGSRLMVAGRNGIEILGRSGALLWRRSATPGTEIVSAALALDERRVAVIAGSVGSGHHRSELLLLGPGGTTIPVFSGPGRFSGVFASAEGRWLLLEWPTADQWLFLDLAHPQGVVAVSNISAQFAPGATSPSAFPSVAGWCCEGPPGAAAP